MPETTGYCQLIFIERVLGRGEGGSRYVNTCTPLSLGLSTPYFSCSPLGTTKEKVVANWLCHVQVSQQTSTHGRRYLNIRRVTLLFSSLLQLTISTSDLLNYRSINFLLACGGVGRVLSSRPIFVHHDHHSHLRGEKVIAKY